MNFRTPRSSFDLTRSTRTGRSLPKRARAASLRPRLPPSSAALLGRSLLASCFRSRWCSRPPGRQFSFLRLRKRPLWSQHSAQGSLVRLLLLRASLVADATSTRTRVLRPSPGRRRLTLCSSTLKKSRNFFARRSERATKDSETSATCSSRRKTTSYRSATTASSTQLQSRLQTPIW